MYIAAAPLALGLMLGAMAFFSFFVAPTAFRVMDEKDAARFVRALFPYYYLFIAVAALAAVAGLVAKEPWMSKLMLLVAAVALFCRQILTPAINRLRDRELEGDAKAGRRFALLHRLSVWLNYFMFGGGLVATAIHV
jgi:hypothetical protein